MFEFNFEVTETNTSDTDESPFKKPKCELKKDLEKEKIDWYQAEEVKLKRDLLNSLDLYELNSKELTIGNIELRHLIAGFLLEDIKAHSDVDSRDIKKSEENHSDLIAGVYEGMFCEFRILVV